MKNKIFIGGFFLLSLFLEEGAFSDISECRRKVSFEKQKIELAGKFFEVDLAKTSDQLSRGLMCRKKIKRGMLFVFKDSKELSFWMKNTLVPLSIGFFSVERKLLNIEEMKEMKNIMELPKKKYQSKGRAKYALEMPMGWFKKEGVKLGEKLRLLPQ